MFIQLSYFGQVQHKNIYLYLYGPCHMEIHRAEEMERTEQGGHSWIDLQFHPKYRKLGLKR